MSVAMLNPPNVSMLPFGEMSPRLFAQKVCCVVERRSGPLPVIAGRGDSAP
jgi:hypothetical protein